MSLGLNPVLDSTQLAAAASGVAGGVLAGFFGVGGNLVLVPLLAFSLGLGQQQAQGLTLAALLPPVGLPAVLEYRRNGVPLLWPVVAAAVVGFVAGSPLGSLAANALPAAPLRLALAVLLVNGAWRQWRGDGEAAEGPALDRPPPGFLPRAALAGLGAGLASGLLGIGGAVVVIPAFRRLGMSQRQAQATSLAMMLPPIALPGVLVYAQAHQALFSWGLLLAVGLGFSAGALAGARLAHVLPPRLLGRGFAVLMAGAAVALLVRGG